jgi:hypothetical protein
MVSHSDNGYSWKQMPGLINQMKSDIAYYCRIIGAKVFF